MNDSNKKEINHLYEELDDIPKIEPTSIDIYDKTELKIFVTPSEVIEYIYCPRFIYFMNVLKIEQHEEERELVLAGRNLHDKKLIQNKEYLRKKIGCIGKELDVYLSSSNLKLAARVDEVLFFQNNEAAPLDYKFTFYENKIYSTHKAQQTLYAMLIEEKFKMKVEKAYLVFVRSKNHIEEIQITHKMRDRALFIVDEIFNILKYNYFPEPTGSKERCLDCTYRNLCF